MANESIDNLEIEVEVSAKSANTSLTNLKRKLETLQEGIDKLDLEKLASAADSLSKLGSVNFEGFNHIPSPSKFKRLAEGISSLAEVDTSKLSEVANAVDKISASTANLGTSGQNGNIQMPNVSGSFTAEDTENIQNAAAAMHELAQSAMEVSAAQKEASADTTRASNEEATAAQEVTSAQKEAAVEAENTGNSMSKSGNRSASAFDRLKSALNGVASASQGMGTLSSSLMNVTGSVIKLETKALSAGKSLAKMSLQRTALGKLPGVFDKISSACSGLNSRLSRTVNLFIMMATRSAFRAVMDELGTAFEHLAQKSSEVNERYSSLISSMNQLAHSIAALAQPLLNIFGPALEYIINLLNTAINYVNQFLSALTGKKYYTTGKQVAYDYAESLQDEADSANDAADAQKELNKQLQSFNELNNMTTNLNNGSGNGTNNVGSNAPEALEDCYEELAINQKILDLVQKLKDLLATLFEPMKSAWDKYGQGVIDSMKYAMSSILTLIEDMGKTWVKVWTNGSGEELCSNILLLLTSIFNWIGDIATAWDKAWKTKGEAYVQSIFDLLNAVLETIIDISETFREAFNNGAGVEMIEHIYQILTNTNKILTSMVKSFKAAWDECGRGQKIAETLFSAINSILTAIEKIQEAWYKVWNNGTGTKICGQILDLVLLVEQAVEGVATAFTNAWEKGGKGEKLIQSILDLFSSILGVIADIGNSLLTVWNNGSGEEIIGHILQIFTDINGAVTALVDNFDKAWKHADTGTSIIQGIADIANTLLEHAQNIYATFRDWCEKLDFSPLLEAFDRLVEACQPLADNIGSGLEWFYKHVLLPIGKWATETAFPVVLDTISGGIRLLNSVIGAAKKNLGWLWTDFLQPIGTWTGNLLTDAFEWFAECLSDLAEVFNGNMSVWDWITNAFGNAYQHTTSYKASLTDENNMDETADAVIESANHGKHISSEVSVKISEDSASDDTVVKAVDSSGKSLQTDVAVGLKIGNNSEETAKKAIESDDKTLSTEVETKIDLRPGYNETATKAIESDGKELSTEVSTKISQDSSSDEDAVKAVNSDKKSLKTTIVTTVEKAANGVSEAWSAIKLASKEGNEKAQASIEANLTEGGSDEAWTILEDGVYKNEDMNIDTSVKLVKSGWDSVTGWFKDKFGGLFGGSSDDESITVKIKLDKKNSDKVDDILASEQTVKIVLSDKSDKLNKVLDDEFTTKVKLSNKSEKLNSILDDEFTTTVKLSNKSEKLDSILDDEFTVNIKLKKKDWNSFTEWIGGTDIEATVKLTPEASSLWNTLKADWSKASGTLEFSANVKDESATWWKNTQTYWSKKVGTVDKFKTNVTDEGATWWKNAQSYWSKKVGTAEKFKTDVKDEGSTWWKNVQTYWKKVVGYVDDFRVKVKDDSKTWWSDVKTYWTNTSASKYLTVMVRGKMESEEDWWTAVAEKLKKAIGTIKADVKGSVYRDSDWWTNVNTSLKNCIGTVYVNVRGRVDYSYNWWQGVHDSIRNSVGTVTVSVVGSRAKGGVLENGSWSDIPQYAGGTVNAGSLFVAGEAGAELVGHIGNRTEVLNESQLAAVMESSVLAGVASLAEYLNGIYKHMTVCANGIIGAIAVNYDTPQVVPETAAYTNEHNTFADEYGRDMSTVIDLLGQIADNTNVEEEMQSDPNGLFTIMRKKNREYREATGKSAFA